MQALQYLLQNQYPVAFYFVVIALVAALFLRRLPSVDSIQNLATMLNTRGGNILLLGAFSFYFFVHAMRLFYNLIDMIKTGQLTPDNAFALMALQFITTSAFGGAFGAMLKTMTGDAPLANGNGKAPLPVVDKPAPAPQPPPAH